jgi:predicted metalloprotease with PDZ domain
MCLDILIREKSNGERGILDLMQKLSREYGPEKPFNDEELFAKITEFTYPEVGQFLKTYVSGITPIPYETFFAKVGVSKMNVKIPENVFLNDKTPYVTVNQETKEIIVIPDVELNPFFKELSIKGNDIIVSINDKKFNLDNIYEMLATSNSWNNDDAITVKIKRDGKEQIIKGKVKFVYKDIDGYEVTDMAKNKLKEAWLKS